MGCEENIVGHDQTKRQIERDRMVNQQIIARGVKDPMVLAVIRHVPRHRFVLEVDASEAYEDYPLSIGHNQTISQPFIVAFMTEALQLQPEDHVLEIGTGSGYQTAVLAHIASKVLSIEIVEPLAKRAEHTLKELGCDNVRVKLGDGYQGWPEEAPFQAIILTAAPEHIPQPLLEQLKIDGRLVLPVGGDPQSLMLIHRRKQGYTQTKLLAVTFVPMTGQAREGR
ncbi:MAG: protein-L-isoaspartate O-methyltransferase [Nitrospirales bacterium]|nr:MAG: protein-L-isoaspartate O-methyltransferase [Nitrospirales bacterium]